MSARGSRTAPRSETVGPEDDNREGRPYRPHHVARGAHRLHVREYPGEGPAVVFLHGFPDNLRLYDRVIPLLPEHHVVLFDFLGWGSSDKPRGYPYSFANLTGDLAAVIDQLRLDRVLLVAHDISGTPAIDWALDHPERTAGLVLLNTFYGPAPSLRMPEVISLFSARSRLLRRLARLSTTRPRTFRAIYTWQLARLIGNRDIARTFLPRLIAPFIEPPSTKEAFGRLNEDLRPAIEAARRRLPAVRAFPRPVHLAFGARDYSLNSGVAEHLHSQFPNATLAPIATAKHFPQLDEPQLVADTILAALLSAQR